MKEYYYSCDGGCVVFGNENFKAHYSNGFGDGYFKLFVCTKYELAELEYSHLLDFVDIVEGDFDVFDYDCGNGKVLCHLNGVYAIYKDNSGKIWLEDWRD